MNNTTNASPPREPHARNARPFITTDLLSRESPAARDSCRASGRRLTRVSDVEVRRVQPEDWEALRDLRIRALADAPDAFATTHADALARPEEWWRDWATRSAGGDAQAMFLAWDGGEPCGIAGAFVDEGRFRVISMW